MGAKDCQRTHLFFFDTDFNWWTFPIGTYWTLQHALCLVYTSLSVYTHIHTHAQGHIHTAHCPKYHTAQNSSFLTYWQPLQSLTNTELQAELWSLTPTAAHIHSKVLMKKAEVPCHLLRTTRPHASLLGMPTPALPEPWAMGWSFLPQLHTWPCDKQENHFPWWKLRIFSKLRRVIVTILQHIWWVGRWSERMFFEHLVYYLHCSHW